MPTPGPDPQPPFADSVEEPTRVDEPIINWLDSAYFAAEVERLEAEVRHGTGGM
jgi:hypothetical protein